MFSGDAHGRAGLGEGVPLESAKYDGSCGGLGGTLSAPSLSESDLQALPIFPLERVVFFPGTQIPLHIFEPRYRDMIEHCLNEGPKAMGLVRALPRDNNDGDPQIAAACGVGLIDSHERLPDGRYHLVLRGVLRATLHELPQAGFTFRRAAATPLVDTGAATRAQVTSMHQAASSLATSVRKKHPRFDFELPVREDAGGAAFLLADQFVADVDARQRILEMNHVGERCEAVTGEMTALIALLQRARHGNGQLN